MGIPDDVVPDLMSRGGAAPARTPGPLRSRPRPARAAESGTGRRSGPPSYGTTVRARRPHPSSPPGGASPMSRNPRTSRASARACAGESTPPPPMPRSTGASSPSSRSRHRSRHARSRSRLALKISRSSGLESSSTGGRAARTSASGSRTRSPRVTRRASAILTSSRAETFRSPDSMRESAVRSRRQLRASEVWSSPVPSRTCQIRAPSSPKSLIASMCAIFTHAVVSGDSCRRPSRAAGSGRRRLSTRAHRGRGPRRDAKVPWQR